TADVPVGTPVANRNRAELEGLIGFFVNTLVLRTDLSGDPTFTELLGRVRRTALDAYAHQDLPFEQLVDALTTERDRSRTPLFQVMFNYTTGGAGALAADVLTDALPAKFDLVVVLGDDGGHGHLVGQVQYSTALFDASTVDRLIGHLVALLDQVATAPGRRLSQLPMMTTAERERLVTGWSDTGALASATMGGHELVAAQAAVRPDAVAVVCDGRS